MLEFSAISSDCSKAISARGQAAIVWDLNTQEPISTLIFRDFEIKRRRDVALNSNNCTALCIYNDNTELMFLNLITRQPIHILKGHTGIIQHIGIALDSSKAISADNVNTLIFWDLGSGKSIHTIKHDYWIINKLLITKTRAICVLAGGAITIFDVNTGKLINTIICKEGKPVRYIHLSSDTMKAIHSTDETLTFWDLNNGQIIHRLEGHTKYIKDVEITANNSRAISVSENETILWDLYKGSKLQHIQSNSIPVTINKNFVGMGKKLFKMEDWHSIILNMPHKPIRIQAPNYLLDVKQTGSLTALVQTKLYKTETLISAQRK